MKRDIGIINIKRRMFGALSCVLMCAAVILGGRGTDMHSADDRAAMQDRIAGNDEIDKADSPDISIADIRTIMVRDQIYFVCPPGIEDERYDAALVKWQEMKYGEAYQLLMEIREERANEYTEDGYETAAANNALGCLCLDMGKLEESYEYLNSAYVVMKKLYGESGVPVLAVLSDITYYDYVAGRMEQCLEDAYRVVSAKPPLPIWIVTNRVQMLVSYELGEYAYAIRGAYRLMDSFMKEQDEEFTWDDMLSLQDYLSHQDREKYDVFVYRCLAMFSLDAANGLAAIAFDEDGRAEAEKWYETCLFICQDRLGEENKGILAKRNIAYARFLGSGRETEISFPLLEKSMHSQEGFGDDGFSCMDLVETYGYYGDMLMFLKHDQEGSLEYYEKARDLSEYIYGVNHNRTARAYFNLGKYYCIIDEQEEALENLKKSEEIRESILLTNDKDTLDLYMYMEVIYRKQGNDALTDWYREKRRTISLYLDQKNMGTFGELFYQKVSEGKESEVLDLSAYNEGQKWERAIDDYINALQVCDRNALMDTLQEEFVKLVPVIASQGLGVEVEQEEIISLYRDFYQEELVSLRSRLIESYGEGYNIWFDPYTIEFVSDYDINFMNDYLFMEYDSEIVLEDMVSITGRFQITGADGAVLGEESEGFLCGEMIMLKADGEWKLGVPEGFPQMPQDRLKDFLGIR